MEGRREIRFEIGAPRHRREKGRKVRNLDQTLFTLRESDYLQEMGMDKYMEKQTNEFISRQKKDRVQRN